MKKFIPSALLLIVFLSTTYLTYHYSAAMGITLTSSTTKILALAFIAGLTFALLLSEISMNKINDSLDAYKRELEKESIDSTERSSRVKVLESKIAVLEKALDEALNK